MHEDTRCEAMDNRRHCAGASQPEDGWLPPQSLGDGIEGTALKEQTK
jgi:hypothetical protein